MSEVKKAQKRENMVRAEKKRIVKSASLLMLFFFIISQCGISSAFADIATNNPNSNLISSTTSVDQASQPSDAATHVDQLNNVAALQQQNPLPAAAALLTTETQMPVTIPQFLITTADGSHIYTPTLNKTSFDDQYVTAQVIYLGDDQWKLDITAKQDISQVWFPWESNRSPLSANKSEEMYYYPYLSGVTEKAENKDTDYAWGWSLEYPGSIFAPLVVMATETKARMVAALNWPPKKVRPVYGGERMGLVYDSEIVKAGTSTNFGALITQVNADLSKGEVPWQMALDNYREWLDPHMGDVEYSDWMWESEGFLEYGLMNIYHAPGDPVNTDYIIDNVSAILDLWGDDFDHVQFWGQMGGYAGFIPKGETVNPWASDLGNCCGLSQTLYSGYGSSFIDFVNQLVEDGYHAGYYSAPHYETETEAAWMLDTAQGHDWLESWLEKNRNEYSANAFYIDVLGRGYFGDPEYVMSLFDTLIPKDTIIEGMVDIYGVAGLISGSLNGGDWGGGPENTPENSDTTTFANFGRYLLNDRIVYLGYANGDHVFWGKYNDYWSERQVFLLGAKFDAGSIQERNADGSDMRTADGSLIKNQMMDMVIQARDAADWWDRRPEYLDTKGLTGLPEGIDIRRFVDKDGKDLIVIDNWDQLSGKSFYMDGVKFFVPTDKISIIDVDKSLSAGPGDANGDGYVDGADYTAWADNYGKTNINSPADFNRDGTIDGADYAVWADHFDPPKYFAPGDANGDGNVDGADYTAWADQYGKTGVRLSGDFNHDEKVDGTDYTIWADHFKPAIVLAPGDANGDSIVDGADYTAWADQYGQSGLNLTGDFNHDGNVDGTDYTIWADHFKPAPTPLVTPVAAVLPTVAGEANHTFPASVKYYQLYLQKQLPTYTVTLSLSQNADAPYTLTIENTTTASGEAEKIVIAMAADGSKKITQVLFRGFDPEKLKMATILKGMFDLNQGTAGNVPISATDISVLLTRIKVTEVDSELRIFFDYENHEYITYEKYGSIINTVNVEGVSKVTLNLYDSGLKKNVERTAWVYVPANYDPSKPASLMFNIHGGYGDGLHEMEWSKMNATADAQNFIAVYPEGLWNAWNAFIPTLNKTLGVDDVGFFRALVSEMENKYNIDDKAIFATGISNGGQMALKLADEMNDVFAAVAIVSSGIGTEANYTPASSVPIMLIQGTADPRIPWEGGHGVGIPDPAFSFMGAEALFSYLKDLNNAQGNNAYLPYAGFVQSDEIIISSSGTDRNQVVTVKVNGGGHTWPGGMLEPFMEPVLGKTSQAIDASKAIVDFFSTHKKVAPVASTNAASVSSEIFVKQEVVQSAVVPTPAAVPAVTTPADSLKKQTDSASLSGSRRNTNSPFSSRGKANRFRFKEADDSIF